MQKLLLILLPCALILAHNGVVVTSSTPEQIKLTVSLPTLQMRTDEFEGRMYTQLYFPEAGISTEIGAPQLPVIRKFVEIPFGANVDVKATVLRNEYIQLEHPVLPLQPPIPKTGPKPDFVINQDIYNANKNTFDVRARIEMIGEIRSHRVALLEIYPVFYNPRENLVDYASEMTIEMNLYGSDILKTIEMRERYYSKPYEMMLSNLVLNYDAYALTPPPNLPVGYLIIVPDEWLSYVQPLAQWRTRKGYKVFVRTLSQVGGGTNNTVRNYILNAYNTWQIPPTFVLLVGDVDKIGYFTGQSAPTDLNYSLMTTPDYLPDIDVSRASVANASQLDSLVKKIIKYERNEWLYGNDWTKKAYFIASSDGGNHQVAENTHRYCMRLMRRYGVICDSLFLYYNSGTPITTAINGGRAWVTYSGHGSTTSWADPNFTTSNVQQLTNVDKVPLVGTYACLSGDFTSSECFSESWIRIGYRGAIAHYASTVTSYWVEDDTLQRRVFDSALDSNYVWAMGMLNKGKLWYFLQMGNTTTTRRYFEMYNMMGDGAIDVYWDIPATLQVNYPPVIPIGTYTIPITVTKNGMPVKNALVCVMSTTDTSKQVSAYTDVNGQVSLQITTTTPDSLSLVVTGHNLAPFFGGIQALPSSGAYVVYLKHIILDPAPGGNGDGVVNPGESVEMRVWLRNFGNATANNVRAWLRTTDRFVTITDSFKNYGNIAGGDSAFILNGFKFNVAVNCTNNHIIRFSLLIKDALDSTWQANISVPVAQCKLIYLSTAVNDASGNNNGIINLGETVNLIVTIKNVGNATANNINSVLSSSTPGILILDAYGNYGSITPNNIGSNQSDPYTIKAESTITPGTIAQFRVIFTAGIYVETLYFSLPIEIYMQGFDLSNGGYIPLPATGGWEWGAPTSGPNSAHSAPNVWATVLAGNYGVDNANWTLTTPELTATCDTPQLKFWHWYSFEGTTTLYDGGNVKISTNNGQTWTVITPVGGYTGTAASGNTALAGQPIYGGSSNGWVEAVFNLPITAGTRFRLRWHFGTDGSVNNYPGWYIDDVTGIGFAPLPPPNNDVGIDAILSPGPNHMPNTLMTPKVKIKNYGGLSQSNFPVICSIVGTAGNLRYLDSVIVPSIASGETLHISFPSWTPTIQEVCTLRFRSKLPNDQVPGNDRMTGITDISPTFQIVIGTATTNSYSGPMNRFYNYSTHEAIYLQPEIGIVGNITRIGYYKDHGTNLDPIENVTIYMKHTTDASLASGTYSLAGYRQVFSGSFTNDQLEGWMEVQLDTPFVYNNTQNLQILIIKGYQQYISTSVCPYYRYTATTTYRTRQAASDASQPTSLTQTYNRPNIRLTVVSTQDIAENIQNNLPLVTALYAPKPNPAINGISKISFALAQPSHTKLNIYDASGRVLKTLVNAYLQPGTYNLIWDGRDNNYKKVGNGIYFLRLQTDNYNEIKKINVIK